MKDEHDFSTGERVKLSREGAESVPPNHLGPQGKQRIDPDKLWARLDALGGADYLPEGAPDDPPAKPDPRVLFDE